MHEALDSISSAAGNGMWGLMPAIPAPSKELGSICGRMRPRGVSEGAKESEALWVGLAPPVGSNKFHLL